MPIWNGSRSTARSSGRIVRRQAPARKRGPDAQGLGRSRGGLTTKVHAAVEALGNAVRLIGTPGQYSDIGQAEALIEGLDAGYVLADRAHDANRLHDAILDSGAIAVIPPMPQRRHQHRYDRAIYKERNRIERFFNKLKQCRRVATQYDKLPTKLMGFVTLAAIDILLR